MIRPLPMPLLFAFVTGPLCSQGIPTMVADLHTGPATSFDFGTMKSAALNGSFTCFLTDDDGALTKLWRTDGTSAGTTLVHTINAYTPTDLEMVARNGLVFFTAPSRDSGIELWVSDGTSAGTLLLDLHAGASSSTPKNLTVDLHTTSTAVYFSAFDGTAGRELWASNGTLAGTRRVADLNPGTASSMLATDEIEPMSTQVYFAASNGTTGRELWRYARSGAPVFQADIIPGSGSSNPRNFVSAMSDLLFTASGASGTELYRLNGNTLTLVDVRPGTASSGPNNLVLHYPQTGARYCFFSAYDGTGYELWRYNLLSGALTHFDLLPGTGGSDPRPMLLGSTLLVVADGATDHRLFSMSPGASAATLLLTRTPPLHVPFDAFTSPAGALVLSFGGEVFHTDGTIAGTVQDSSSVTPPVVARLPGGTRVLCADGRVVDNQPSSTPHTNLVPQIGLSASGVSGPITAMADGSVLFTATTTTGASLFRSDGTAAGTFPIGVAGMELSQPLNGRHYYVLWNGSSADLHATDGTVAGTGLVAANVCTTGFVTPQVQPRNYTILGSRMLIMLGETLVATEGTAATTVVLQQSPVHLFMLFGRTKPVVAGGHAYFAAGDAAHGIELWRTDGTPAGTQLFLDANPGPADGLLYLVKMQWKPSLGAFLLCANDGVHGYEPWRSDGTLAGTYMVKDVTPGAGQSYVPNSPMFFDDDQMPALFEATTPSYGVEPWLTDGTTAGTFLLVDATTGPDPSYNIQLVGRLGGTLLVGAGPYLLETQGTVASTSNLVNQASLTCRIGVPAFGGSVVPTTHGLWRASGTLAGTTQLSTNPTTLAYGIPQGTNVLLSMLAVGSGEELWRTDGTVAGTTLHADLHPGAFSSQPRDFVLAGSRIFFTADDGIHGRELWVMDAMAGVIPFGTACAGSSGMPGISATTPRLGTSFDVTLSGALGNTAGAMLMGFAPAAMPLGGGCTQLVSTLAPYASLFVVTTPQGRTSVATAIPNSSLFVGLPLHCQFGILDPGGAFQNLAAFSAGVLGIVGM